MVAGQRDEFTRASRACQLTHRAGTSGWWCQSFGGSHMLSPREKLEKTAWHTARGDSEHSLGPGREGQLQQQGLKIDWQGRWGTLEPRQLPLICASPPPDPRTGRGAGQLLSLLQAACHGLGTRTMGTQLPRPLVSHAAGGRTSGNPTWHRSTPPHSVLPVLKPLCSWDCLCRSNYLALILASGSTAPPRGQV